MVLSRFLRSRPAAEPSVPTCTIDFQLGDDRASLSALIERMTPFRESATRWQLDLTKVNYIGPSAAAILYADFLMSGGVSGQSEYDLLLPINPKVGAFLHFSGLDHYINRGPKPDKLHPENVTVALRRTSTATFDMADPVIQLIRRFSDLPEDTEDYLDYLTRSMSEIMHNVEDHSESSIGAVWCARYLKKPGKIRVAIVDRGLGIGTTLRRRHHDIVDVQEALRKTVEGGISAKSRPTNMGLGISNLWKQITLQLQGDIFIVSEDGVAYNRGVRVETSPLGTRFAGTGVFFTVPVPEGR